MTTATKPTSERLAEALTAIGLSTLAEKASKFMYDDFKGDSPAPQTLLLSDLEEVAKVFHQRGFYKREEACRLMQDQVRRGEWGGTAEEAKAWAETQDDPELRRMMGVDRK